MAFSQRKMKTRHDMEIQRSTTRCGMQSNIVEYLETLVRNEFL